jgi:hypothetical protein
VCDPRERESKRPSRGEEEEEEEECHGVNCSVNCSKSARDGKVLWTRAYFIAKIEANERERKICERSKGEIFISIFSRSD